MDGRRTFEIELQTRDEKARTVEASISSEYPVSTFDGKEILVHTAEAVDLSRAPLPLIDSHDTSRLPVGVVEQLRLVGRKLRGLLRFGESEKAREIWEDVKAGIIKNLSIGYRYLAPVEWTDNENFMVTRWQPYEVSLVAVPADPTVGIGRSYQKKGFSKMNDKGKTEMELERDRVLEIQAYGKQWNMRELADDLIRDGVSIEDARKRFLSEIRVPKPIQTGGDIGLSGRDVKKFDLLRLIRSVANNRVDDAAFEREVCDAAAKLRGRPAKGFMVPHEVLQIERRRDLTVGTDSAGGYLVGTQLLAGSFIDLLRNKAVVLAAGATVLNGLQGDVAIPKQTGAATAYWVAENADVTAESNQTFGQVALAPRTIGAYTDLSRKLVMQSTPSAQDLVKSDLARVLAIGIDLASLHGSGVNPEPAGIAITGGIGAVVGGTNGGAPTWDDIVSLETEVSVDNADVGALAYITNAKVRGKLKKTFVNATYGETPMWTNGPDGTGRLNGYRAFCTNQVSSTLTKGSANGTCSAIFFGNWADLLFGFWAGVDILVDPYTFGTKGAVRIVALQDVDMAVRNAVSFAAMLDALTT
jgi:HK97 family phage major capsid protein/HK97 family phage prohead protease